MLLHTFKWKEVSEAKEPVLVDFWATWCGPCRAMNPTLESLAKDFEVCKINVDANQELAARFRVSAVPTLLIFKDGKVVARHEGAVSESILRADLERYR